MALIYLSFDEYKWVYGIISRNKKGSLFGCLFMQYYFL